MQQSYYDDRKLREFFASLDPKARKQLFKRAFRRQVNKLKKEAVKNLRASVNSNPELERGVRALVYKRAAGFRVTVGAKAASAKSKKEYGMYTNRRGLKKPVLIWLEKGTAMRKTRHQVHRHANGRFRNAKWWAPAVGKMDAGFRGRIKAHGFIEKAFESSKDNMTNELHSEIIYCIERLAKKHGST